MQKYLQICWHDVTDALQQKGSHASLSIMNTNSLARDLFHAPRLRLCTESKCCQMQTSLFFSLINRGIAPHMLQPYPPWFISFGRPMPASAFALLPRHTHMLARQGQTRPDKGCHKIGQLRNHCFHSVYCASCSCSCWSSRDLMPGSDIPCSHSIASNSVLVVLRPTVR